MSRTGRHLNALTHGRGLVGTLAVGLVVLAGLAAPVLAPYAPDAQIPGANLLGPGAAHWFGTDTANRDILSRTLYGIRTNLLLVVLAVPAGAVTGGLAGLVSAQWRWLDGLIQRSFDLVLAFPTILLAIAVTMILGPGLWTVFLVTVLAEIPVFGRLVRGVALSVRERPYVEAARTVGAPDTWILRHHILPNSIDPLIVQLAVAMSVAVFVEGAMSFLGLGVVPPTPSLGSLINEGAAYAWHAPFYAVGPLAVVVLLTLGLLLIAQALSHATRNEVPA
ncbi:ABC transporter permease [uncultured Corynebacterium sp.]|uniref:ABC transporter permease n=1 Tax=uncultured Corynebacterium sp. TaxID=159447 RepID=UPI0025DAB50E|nr:ABC transporter permease [uncultured Corynebacterium sp.]